ncbi:LysR family transcriptional regulator [Thalassotalea euphylliae]|uniref:LysR family transcriptional regulator n=1 Tax=Thalassotalea euphylliae TaxID=1655234 RepID=UPI00362CA3B1
MLSNVDLNDLMVFKKVVDLGSFTKAADALDLPKSNISRKVTRLEQALSVRLMERSTRSLHLTEIGQVYYQHCQRISDELTQADLCIENLSEAATGTILLGCSVGVGQSLIAPLLSDFNQAYPNVNVDLKLTNRRVDVIEEGYDLVVRVGESPDSNLISKRLQTVTMRFYASNTYVEICKDAGVTFDNPSDLNDHGCLYMNENSNKSIWHVCVGDKEQDVNISPLMMSNDFNVLKSLAEQGLGITLLPEYMVDSADSDLVEVNSDWVGRSVNFYAIYPSRLGATPKVVAMVDFLAQRIKN